MRKKRGIRVKEYDIYFYVIVYFTFLNTLYHKTFQININITQNNLNQTQSLYKSMNYFAIGSGNQNRSHGVSLT